MVDGRTGASQTVLLSLFWALQGSLLSWCYLQLKGGTSTPAASELARDILLQCKPVLRPLLLTSHTGLCFSNALFFPMVCSKV